MNIDKYTERARGFVQSAQSLALREGHHRGKELGPADSGAGPWSW